MKNNEMTIAARNEMARKREYDRRFRRVSNRPGSGPSLAQICAEVEASMPKFESDVVTSEMLTDAEACSIGGNLPASCYIDYPYERPDRDKPENKERIIATLMDVLALPLAPDVRERAEARMAILRGEVAG